MMLASCGSQQGSGETQDSTTKKNDSTASVAKDWKIGVQLWTFHYVSFDTALAKADSAGVKYLEAFPGQPLGAATRPSADVFGAGWRLGGSVTMTEREGRPCLRAAPM